MSNTNGVSYMNNDTHAALSNTRAGLDVLSNNPDLDTYCWADS